MIGDAYDGNTKYDGQELEEIVKVRKYERYYYSCLDANGDYVSDLCYEPTLYSDIYKIILKYKLENANAEKTLRKTQDDDGDTYYYRGVSSDNYVNFAGMCWKIVRINGDGSTKVILEDQNTTCESTSYTGNWIGPDSGRYPDETDDTGYNYYVSGSLSFSGFNKTLTTKISSVYSKDISDYLLSGNWCWESKGTTSLSKYNSLKCYGTKQSGYTATITSSELSYLGEVDTSYLYSLYEQEYIAEAIANYTTVLDSAGFTLLTTKLGGSDVLTTRGSFWVDGGYLMYTRPAVNLKAAIEISGGDGTKSNPYVIK